MASHWLIIHTWSVHPNYLMNNEVSQTAQCCFGGGPTSPTSAHQCNIIGPVSRVRGVVTISLGFHANLFFCHWAVTQHASDKIVQILDTHSFYGQQQCFFCIYLPMDRLLRIPLTVITLSPKKILRKLVKFSRKWGSLFLRTYEEYIIKVDCNGRGINIPQ